MASAWTIHRIGLWGPCGSGNMGNEMTMSALVQNLRRLHPQVALYGFTWNPQDTLERHGIDSFPIRRGGRASRSNAGPPVATGGGAPGWKARLQGNRLYRAARTMATPLLEWAFLKKSRRNLNGIDLLIFAGTGPFTDAWGGVMNFPYSIYQWTRLCRSSGTKVAVVSTGAGPIDSGLSKRLLRAALDQCAYRSFRDEESKQLVASLGVKGETHVYPDLAFSLPIPAAAAAAGSGNPREVALLGLPYRKPGLWENPSAEAYERYLQSMTEFTSWLLGQGYTMRLVVSQANMDPPFNEDLRSRIRQKGLGDDASRIIVEPAETFEQLMLQLARAGIVVTARFHGVVFSYRLGRAVVGVSYHPKINALMKEFGQQEFCLNLPTVQVDDLCRKFRQLETSRQDACRQIQETSGLYQAALEEQYQRLLRL